MPSYRYTKDIKPEELQQETEPEYSKKDRAKNWWHYHWKWLLLGAAALGLVAVFVLEVVRVEEPDLSFGIVTREIIPDGLNEKVKLGLEELTAEESGESVLAEVLVFNIDPTGSADASDFSEAGEAAVSASVVASAPSDVSGQEALPGFAQEGDAGVDAYSQMAGVVQLSALMDDDEMLLFMVEPTLEGEYQRMIGLFEVPEGQAVQDATVAWKDVPALAALDLTFSDLYGNEYDGQEILADYRVGMRAYTGSHALGKSATARARWQQQRDMVCGWAGAEVLPKLPA